MISTGIDLAYIPRFKDKAALAKKILTPDELIAYEQHPLPEQFLAGRFAAKEAFIKAWNQLPYPALPSIEVQIGLHGKTWIVFEQQTYALSIAHDGQYATAIVIIEFDES
jgi:holo-[acyl-carrier protein] synthase